MRLVIGGFAQGKLSYVLSKYPGAEVIDETNFEDFTQGGTLVINHFHMIAKSYCKSHEKANVEEITDALLAQARAWSVKSKECIVISDEIGDGIVPMDGTDRLWREVTGRVLVELAKQAESVERIICQLPQKLK